MDELKVSEPGGRWRSGIKWGTADFAKHRVRSLDQISTGAANLFVQPCCLSQLIQADADAHTGSSRCLCFGERQPESDRSR